MMTRKYVPTGRPRGRPRKTVQPKNGTATKLGSESGMVQNPECVLTSLAPGQAYSDTQKNQPQKHRQDSVTPQTLIKTEKKDFDHVTKSDSANLSEQDYAEILAEQGERLEKVVKRVLPTADARARACAVKALQLTIQGKGLLEACTESGLGLPRLKAWDSWHKDWLALWLAARATGEEVRKALRLEVLEKHAVEGTEKPVFWQGVVVGAIREFDHKLGMWLVEADNPAKYRPSAASVNIANQVGVVVQFSGGAPLTPEESAAEHVAGNRVDSPPVAQTP